MAVRRTDLDNLQGTWRVVALESDGQSMPQVPPDAAISVKGDTFTATGMGNDYAGTLTLDPAKSPKTIDLTFTTGPEKGNRNVGIYRLEGARWRLCLATRGMRRPRTFATRAGSGVALEVLERASAAQARSGSRSAKTKASVPPTLDLAASGEAGPPTELEGTWQMVSAVFSGAPMDEKTVQWVQRTTKGNLTTVMAGPQVMLKATFTLDASRKPRAIDYINVAGAQKGKRQAGIYDLKGDTLRICIAAPGNTRPAEFSSARGDGRSFTTWRRT